MALHEGIRPLVRRGDLYRLRPPRGGLSAVQYVFGDGTAVLARLQAQHHGEPVPAPRWRGLDPEAPYACRETGEVHRGAVPLHHGVCLALRGDLDATVIRLRRI
ncbi:GH36 C-terminal domain-containing protein [Streptomyces lancefieldiae]|uniref:GH36 C-terminal domain-containing protein n=1 Tax=Streptomyces lancefieldiae TaxID=3075520 RepID=UPI00374DFD07